MDSQASTPRPLTQTGTSDNPIIIDVEDLPPPEELPTPEATIEALLESVNNPKNYSILREGTDLPVWKKLEVLDSSYSTKADFTQQLLLSINGKDLYSGDERNGEDFLLRIQTHLGLFKLANNIHKLRLAALRDGKTLYVSLKRQRRLRGNDFDEYEFSVEDSQLFFYDALGVKRKTIDDTKANPSKRIYFWEFWIEFE